LTTAEVGSISPSPPVEVSQQLIERLVAYDASYLMRLHAEGNSRSPKPDIQFSDMAMLAVVAGLLRDTCMLNCAWQIGSKSAERLATAEDSCATVSLYQVQCGSTISAIPNDSHICTLEFVSVSHWEEFCNFGLQDSFLTRCFLKVSAEVLYSFKEDLLLGSSALGHQVDVVLDFAPQIW